MLEQLKADVARWNQELPRNNLVAWTSGNVSGRDPGGHLIVMKPSGVRYEDMRPEHMIVLDLDGKILEGTFKPSFDTDSHLYIYRARPDVGAVVHTHSRYATAFAAVGMPVPCVLTAMADEFGGPIPCAGFALIGGEEIGKTVVETIGASPAVLLQNHGVFAIGRNPEAAVKAAVMTEDTAATVWHALQIGKPIPMSDADIVRLHEHYTREYGQRD
ncbi:MAG TPA: L-ribulose-5-phosphate 4-epimerase [Anaerolineales bacterium]|nr:L-ribulose-5-phosphate 4-epimerase [Anaerolineales bacterium]